MANKKILVVEDDVMLLEMIKIQLGEMGYDAFTAENGKDGLFKAIQEKPDLIIADIMMPELDGNEMIKLIRQDQRLAKTPIVVVSALGRETDVSTSLQAGANDYIIKPFFAADLEKLLKKHLT
jgi:two-component system alkaline phosphatase synthesis response regulator PhoP